MPEFLKTIEIEALETLHKDRGDVDRIGDAQSFCSLPEGVKKLGEPVG